MSSIATPPAAAPADADAAMGERLAALSARLGTLERERSAELAGVRRRIISAQEGGRGSRVAADAALTAELLLPGPEGPLQQEMDEAFGGEGAARLAGAEGEEGAALSTSSSSSVPTLDRVWARAERAGADANVRKYDSLRRCVERAYGAWGQTTLWLLLLVTGVRPPPPPPPPPPQRGGGGGGRGGGGPPSPTAPPQRREEDRRVDRGGGPSATGADKEQ
jgi:hypothetical protein